MPRQARLDMPGALHHIMVRGINKEAVFSEKGDKEQLLQRLGINLIDGKGTVYAWVIMNNHLHLLIKSGKRGISDIMRKLLTWYAQYYNRRHRRRGHLFENRYKSILCDEETYLLALIRYIHLNPVRAGIVGTMKELDEYPWSGHSAIMGKASQSWMDIDYVLAQFGTKKRAARNAYRQFVEEGMTIGRKPELTGGGLLRSGGGWSEVVARRRKGQKEEFDERILGGRNFVHEVLKEAEDRQIRQLEIQRRGITIEAIIKEECTKVGISETEVKAGSRRGPVSRLRATIAYRSREELGLSAAEVARHMGMATSSITRAIDRVRHTA
jgi:putative transposase